MVQIQLCLFLLGSHISSPRLGQVSNADAHGQMWTCSDYHLATRYKFAIIGQFWGERTDAESWLTWLNLNLHWTNLESRWYRFHVFFLTGTLLNSPSWWLNHPMYSQIGSCLQVYRGKYSKNLFTNSRQMPCCIVRCSDFWAHSISPPNSIFNPINLSYISLEQFNYTPRSLIENRLVNNIDTLIS